MRIHVSYQGLEKKNKKSLNGFIREQAEKLEEKLGPLADHDPGIKATVQKHSKKPRYRFGANLHVLHKIISAEEEGEDAFAVIREVFSELERQAQRYKSRLKNEHLWKRKARRKQLGASTVPGETTGQTSATAQPHETAASLLEQITPCLDDLYDFAVREITYLQAVDDLRPSDILPDELVDAVVVSAYEKQAQKPEELDMRAWLHQLAIDLLDEEVGRSMERRKAISLETVIEDEDIDTDIYEFYQPDEVLKLEDLIGTPEQLPEVEAKIVHAEQSQAQQGVARLPRTWRRAVLLHHGAGFPVETVAAIMRTETAMIQELLAIAARFLNDMPAASGGISVERIFTVRRLQCPAPLHTELENKFSGKKGPD